MADTFEEVLGIRLIETGAYEHQWGAVLNSDALAMLAKAVTAESAISLNSTSYSLPAMGQGTASVTRSFCLGFDGAPGGPVTVTVPGSVIKKFYLVDNRCGQAITMTYGSGSTATIAAGEKRFVWCDGANCTTPSANATDATTVGGIAPTLFARRDQSNVFTGGRNSSPWVNVNEQPITTIDAGAGNHQRLTLTSNRAMAAPINTVDGQMIVLQVRQDASGGRTLTWDSVFVFENGLPPTLAAGANGIDLFIMMCDSTNSQWIVGHFASIASSSGASLNLTIESNQVDYNLAAVLGAVGTPITLTVTIGRGVVLSAGSTGSYAFDCNGALPAGSTLNIVNNGYVLGRGGDGGDGAAASYEQGGSGNQATELQASNGRDGGGALRLPGSGVTVNITNGSGFIWGGGGGGGGGGASLSGGANRVANGGGGGGGAGGGRGGIGGKAQRPSVTGPASDGTHGSTGVFGAAGPGGGAGSGGGGSEGGAGGAGGDWGAAGAAGTGATSGTQDYTAGSAGAAGKAIELNGGGSPSFVSGNGSPNIRGAIA